MPSAEDVVHDNLPREDFILFDRCLIPPPAQAGIADPVFAETLHDADDFAANSLKTRQWAMKNE